MSGCTDISDDDFVIDTQEELAIHLSIDDHISKFTNDQFRERYRVSKITFFAIFF